MHIIKIVALFIVVATVVSADTHDYGLDEFLQVKKPAYIPIVRYIGNLRSHGHYDFEHEGGDGTKISEVGSLKNIPGVKEPTPVKTGSVSWTSPEGIPFSYTYIADETGFHPVGSHLPTPPPPPPEILKVLPLLPKLNELKEEEDHRQQSFSANSPSSFSQSAPDVFETYSSSSHGSPM